MSLEKEKTKRNLNPLNGILTRIEKVPTKYFTAYMLYLDNGTTINLPAIAGPTVKKLRVGDTFEFSPRENIYEGRLKRYDDQTRVLVKSTNDSPLSFIIGNDCLIPQKKS